MLDIENADDVMMVNSGGLCEQFVGQHLLYLNEYYKKPELYYWVREAKSSSAKVLIYRFESTLQSHQFFRNQSGCREGS